MGFIICDGHRLLKAATKEFLNFSLASALTVSVWSNALTELAKPASPTYGDLNTVSGFDDLCSIEI